VVLVRDLRAALVRLNPDLPESAREQAVEKITRIDFARSLIQHNREYYGFIRDGSRDVPRRDLFYNLAAIISVGYRVKSRVATQFRIWATQRWRDAWRAGRSFSCQLLVDNWGRRQPAPIRDR
jgi:hypothetical protein